MLQLLTETLQRIDSLQQFYLLELKSIERKSSNGIKKNRMAMLISLYLHIYSKGSEEQQKSESFLALKEVMDECIDIINMSSEETGTRFTFSLKENKYIDNIETFDVKKGANEYFQYAEMPVIHSNNVLIMLIVRFEEFISKFIEQLYALFPNKYLNNQVITFEEIENVGIDEVKSNIIQRETEAIMHKSYMEWFKLFESHKMSFENCKNEMSDLQEIYARRNILVHNSGKVNRIYLKNVPESEYQIGDVLFVDKHYIENAFNTVKKIIYSIIIESRKFFPSKSSAILNEAFNQAFDEMLKNHYDISLKVYDILKSISSQDDSEIFASKVNYWISKKALFGIDSIKKEVEDFDTSALKEMFHLAKNTLLDDNISVTVILDAMLKNNDISVEVINEWPLFKDYRNTDQYNALKQKHAELFDTQTIETCKDDNDINVSIRSELKEI